MRMTPLLLLPILLASHALGQDQEPAIPEAKVRWEVSIEPAAWFVGAGGSVKLPRSSGASPARTQITDLNMDGTQLTPSGEVNLRRGAWGSPRVRLLHHQHRVGHIGGPHRGCGPHPLGQCGIDPGPVGLRV
jgi:hypothetical protein